MNMKTDTRRGRTRYLNHKTCRVMRQSDEMACACGLRWAIDDEEPPLCAHQN